MNWRLQAACIDADPAIFHSDNARIQSEAKTWCAQCPVVHECRDFADSFEMGAERFGVYGNTTPSERSEKVFGIERTKCSQGHDMLTPDQYYLNGNGSRQCKTCKNKYRMDLRSRNRGIKKAG